MNLEDIHVEKRNNSVLETSNNDNKTEVPVDAELFNAGFQSSSDINRHREFLIHEWCIKCSLAGNVTDNNLIESEVLNAAQQKYLVCNRYAASLSRLINSCSCHFHLLCAQSSDCFFSHAQLALLCP